MRRCLLTVLFAIYVLLLLRLTLFDPHFGRRGFAGFNMESFLNYCASSVNLLPFRTVAEGIQQAMEGRVLLAAMNLVGNLIAFAPFALFLPLFFRKVDKFPRFLLCMIAISAAIELTQLFFQTGVCDIDDILLNTAGACILYTVLHIPTVARVISWLTRLPYGTGRYP